MKSLKMRWKLSEGQNGHQCFIVQTDDRTKPIGITEGHLATVTRLPYFHQSGPINIAIRQMSNQTSFLENDTYNSTRT